MDIIASNPQPGQQHPAWCAADLPTGDSSFHHIGAEARVDLAATESSIYVSIESAGFPGEELPPGSTFLVVDGVTGEFTLRPDEALQLAAVLTRSANTALGTPAEDDITTWARGLVDMPAEQIATTHGYTVDKARHVQHLVDILLAEVVR